MHRLLSALREWLEVRTRVREERLFHLDRAAADLRALGLNGREAKRMARVRFGAGRNSRAGLRELGGDVRGLVHLVRVYRVFTSMWLQPAVVLLAMIVMLALSPVRRELMEGVLGYKFGAAKPTVVSLEVEGAGPASPGIALNEIDALQSMSLVTGVMSSGPHQVVGRPAPGATLAVIAAEARWRTGNRAFHAEWIEPQPKVMTGPAKVVWVLIAMYGAFFLVTRAGRVSRTWFAYASSVGCLHAVASITMWALATQGWGLVSWGTSVHAGLSFSLLVVVFLLVAAAQCWYWWHDLRHRCPVCLDRLLLSWTQGAQSSVLLSVSVTESVCAHGHGVLSESRWTREYTLSCAP